MTDLFKPRGAGQPRRPTDDSKNNGPIINPPRYAKMGGLSGASKFPGKNSMTLRKPGDGRKVI